MALGQHRDGHNEGKKVQHDDGPRGKSPSRPDQDGTGRDAGLVNDDKQHDGNNGCGNDPDREDDNNGRCKGRSVHPTPKPSSTHSPGPSPTPQVSPSPTATDVGPTPVPTESDAPPVGPKDSPAVQATDADAPTASNLPETGENVATFVALGLALAVFGVLLYLTTRGPKP